MVDDIEAILDAIRRRFVELNRAPKYRESFLAHLRTLGRYMEPIETTDVSDVAFPSRLCVAFAVCRCGVREFIVDGSTQECQNCSSLMFRTELAEYAIVGPPAESIVEN